MSISTAGYKKMLMDLLPSGPLWRYLSATFQLFLEAFAVELNRVDTRVTDLRREANPATATTGELLSEWEAMVLLPDEMPLGSETQTQRQQVVAAKYTTVLSGPSRNFFIGLAAKFGMTIVITEGGVVNPARVGTARVGTARANAASNAFIWNIQVAADPNSQLAAFQRMVARLKPAHTSVTYT